MLHPNIIAGALAAYFAGLEDAPGEFIKWFIIVAAGLGSFIFGVYKVARPPEKLPQPLRTVTDTEYATAAGVRNLADEVDELRAALTADKESHHRDMADMERRITASGEARAAAIHDRINALTAPLHSLDGQVKEISKLLHELTNKRKA
jgi:hypothetical protein